MQGWGPDSAYTIEAVCEMKEKPSSMLVSLVAATQYDEGGVF